MSPLILSPVLILACSVLSAADTPADPATFRTVATAKTSLIEKASTALGGRPGYLGVEFSRVDSGGAVVSSVELGSPARAAGIEAGDVLSEISGTAVKGTTALSEAIQSIGEGVVVPVRLTRAGKPMELQVRLASASRPKQLPERQPVLGLRLSDRTDGDGLVARTILRGSPPAKAGMKSGDILLKIDGSLIRGPFDVSIALADHQPGDKVKLTLLRDGGETELDYPLIAETDRDLGVAPARNIWNKDVFRLAIVCVEFPDVPHNEKITTADWQESLFSRDAYRGKKSSTGQPVFGSFSDYYREVSNGTFRPEGRVFDWVKTSKNRADYNQGTNPTAKAVLLNEALDLIIARDGKDALDGYDGFFFLYAGERFPTTNRGSLYWPHRANFQRKIAGKEIRTSYFRYLITWRIKPPVGSKL